VTLSVTLQADIVRLYHVEHWRIGTIAAQLGVHHSSVRRVLSAAGIALPVSSLRIPSEADHRFRRKPITQSS